MCYTAKFELPFLEISCVHTETEAKVESAIFLKHDPCGLFLDVPNQVYVELIQVTLSHPWIPPTLIVLQIQTLLC